MEFIYQGKTIKVFDKIIDKFTNLFPNKKCLIAGGAVRDFLLKQKPRDFDVYFLDIKKKDAIKTAYSNIRKINNKPPKRIEVVPPITAEYPNESSPFLSIKLTVGDFIKQQKLMIQFMAFEGETVEELLKEFDWSICMYAYEASHGRDTGQIISTQESEKIVKPIITAFAFPWQEQGSTPMRVPILLNHVRSPINTLRRGFDFEKRYPIRLDKESIVKLCSEVIQEKVANKLIGKEDEEDEVLDYSNVQVGPIV